MDALIKNLENLARLIVHAPWADALFVVRIVFIVLDIALLAGLVWLIRKASEFRPPFMRAAAALSRRPSLDQKAFRERWARIVGRAAAAPPQSYTVAVIEADKCVDDALKQMGFSGEHMADRLEQLDAADYPGLDRLWRAHRMRNELVHAPDFGIDANAAEEALKIYESFLRELGALPS
ncbi:MAG: hypothetical protein HYU81_03140 [Candidatus Brennerbacteria bacterium]|nr:hypothetical protein [Candidatus Brennerbacteria bacterium]